MCVSVVLQGVEDRGEGNEGCDDGEQDGSGAEVVARSEIEAGGAESGNAGGEGLLHECPLPSLVV
jgi:hypothetical protein